MGNFTGFDSEISAEIGFSMQKQNLYLLIILFSVFNCKKIEKTNNEIDKKTVKVKIPEEKPADTIKEPDYIVIFDEETGYKTDLSQNELKVINQNIIKAVNDYNDKLKISLDKWNKENKSSSLDFEKEKLNLRYFYRQYFVTKNNSGDKIVRVFCFCSDFNGIWKNEEVHVNDGGDCFLNVKINVSKNKIEYFGTHGKA